MVRIRPAVPADAGEVLTVQRAAFVTEAQLHDDVHMEPLTQTLDEVREAITDSTVLVAVDGARVVGSVRARLEGPYWRIARLVCAPDRQGQGIGTALLAAVEALAPSSATAYELDTGPKSLANIRLYERCGYVQAPSDSILIRLTKEIVR